MADLLGLLGPLPPLAPPAKLLVLEFPQVCPEQCCVAVMDPTLPRRPGGPEAVRPMYQVLEPDYDPWWDEPGAEAMRVLPSCWEDPLFRPL